MIAAPDLTCTNSSGVVVSCPHGGGGYGYGLPYYGGTYGGVYGGTGGVVPCSTVLTYPQAFPTSVPACAANPNGYAVTAPNVVQGAAPTVILGGRHRR